MKKLTLAILFLSACGSQQRNHQWDENVEKYIPKHLDLIDSKLESETGASKAALKSVTFYHGDVVIIDQICASLSHGADIFACIYTQEADSFFDSKYKDHCRIVTHELIHQALEITQGDADHDHTNPLFNQTYELCDSLGIPREDYI